MIVTQYEVDNLISEVEQAGGNVIKDYILAIGEGVDLREVIVPIQVLVDVNIKDCCYLVERKYLKKLNNQQEKEN